MEKVKDGALSMFLAYDMTFKNARGQKLLYLPEYKTRILLLILHLKNCGLPYNYI